MEWAVMVSGHLIQGQIVQQDKNKAVQFFTIERLFLLFKMHLHAI